MHFRPATALVNLAKQLRLTTPDSLSWLLPQHCLLCSEKTTGSALCSACQDDLPYLTERCDCCALPLPQQGLCGRCLKQPPSFHHCICPLRYQEPIVSLVTALKFRRRLEVAEVLAELMAEAVETAPATERPQLLIPVPLHPRRLRQRGYNQALLLAQPVADKLAIPLATTLCRRTLHNPAQLGLNRKQRQRNLKHAFKVTERPLAKHVAIIDDVLTTGSTADALASSLRQAGVERVDIWVVARVEKTMGHRGH